MSDRDDKWWWCLKHQAVEHGPGCPNDVRLGPFDTEEEAADALKKAADRNEQWDSADRDWTGDNE